MAKAKKKKSAAGRQLLAIVIALAIIGGAVAIFALRDKIGAALSGKSASDGSEPWSFEAGSAQCFAPAGNGLAVASSTGVQLLDSAGQVVCRHVCSLGTPAVDACDSYAVAWDIGAKTLVAADVQGKVTTLKPEGAIISATVSAGGYLAVTTEKAGYKGMVTVYDSSFTAVYQWYSGEGYPLIAQVSPSGTRLAVLTASESGGVVHIFALSSETEKAAFTAPGELLVDAAWLSDDSICALSETRAVFLDENGEQTGEYPYDGAYLSQYSLSGGGYATLALSKYLSGSATLLVTVEPDGKVTGTLTPESELKDLSASGKQVAALWSDGAAKYSQSLSVQGKTDEVQGAKGVLLTAKGEAMLLYSSSAQNKSM